MMKAGGILLILTGILELIFGARVIASARPLWLISDLRGTIVMALAIVGLVFSIAAMAGGIYAAAGKRFTLVLFFAFLTVVGALFTFWPLAFVAVVAAFLIVFDRKAFAA